MQQQLRRGCGEAGGARANPHTRPARSCAAQLARQHHTSSRRRLVTSSRAAAAAASTQPATMEASQQQQQHPPLPATFKRLVARRTGSSFREVAEVDTAPLPVPGPNEVLVRLQFAGINGGCETFRARGEYAFAGNKAKPEYALGAEGAGVIAALGADVKGLRVGQAVACNGAAAFAEYGVCQAHMVTPLHQHQHQQDGEQQQPEAATPEAVALTLSAVTAAVALEGTAKLQPGEVVVVTAAAGGTGHFAVQLAQLAGARVVAVTGSQAKKERLAALGLERVINYREEDVGQVLAQEYPGGVDVVYEGVGGQLRAAIMQHLAPNARVLQVGYITEYPHTGQQVSAAAEGLTMDQLFWGGKTLDLGDGKRVFGQVWPKDVGAIRACRQRVFELHAAGKLQAWVDASHGFRGVEQVPDAIDYMLRGGHTGKVVIPL